MFGQIVTQNILKSFGGMVVGGVAADVVDRIASKLPVVGDYPVARAVVSGLAAGVGANYAKDRRMIGADMAGEMMTGAFVITAIKVVEASRAIAIPGLDGYSALDYADHGVLVPEEYGEHGVLVPEEYGAEEFILE